MSQIRSSSAYRWLVLGSFMFVNLTIQTLWISYAPITGPAAAFYGVSDLRIGFFAMTYMIAFIPFSLPASWTIDTFGFRKAVGLGVILMGFFGILRGFSGSSYALALGATIGIAVSQPFLLNAWTTVPAKWFPREQRATAVGLITLANLVGTAAGMVVTPNLVESGWAIDRIQLIYGILAAISAVLFLVFARESPKQSVETHRDESRALVLDGLKNALISRPFWFTLAASFIGLGVFNGVSTWVEGIVRPRGFSPSVAGTVGALMIAGGLVGAVIIPSLSDRSGKRQPFLFIAFAGAVPGLLGLTFAQSLAGLFASSVVLGFFLVSALPIAMQYAAEITFPTPEGTSNGLIQLFGQGAVVFVYLMEVMKSENGSFTPSLLLAGALLAACLGLVAGMKDKKPQA